MTVMVLRLVGKNRRGGARRHVFQLNRYLEKKKIKTLTLIPEPPQEDPLSSASLVKCDYRHAFSFSSALAVAKQFKSQIAFVHSHLRNANIIGHFIAKMTGKPHIITVHGPVYQPPKAWKDKVMLVLLRRAMRSAALVIFISRYVQGEVLRQLKLSPAQVRGVVIYNGSEATAAAKSKTKAKPVKKSPRTKKELNVVVAGELTERRNMNDLIRLAEDPELRSAAVTFHVYGEGPYLEKLKSHKNIQCYGYETSQKVIFEGKDVHMILSKNEGFGRVVTEAMAYGLPTVAYRYGAMPELITHRQTGFLALEREEIRDALLHYLEQKALVKKMGEQARKTFEAQFTEEMFCKTTYDTLKPFLNPQG